MLLCLIFLFPYMTADASCSILPYHTITYKRSKKLKCNSKIIGFWPQQTSILCLYHLLDREVTLWKQQILWAYFRSKVQCVYLRRLKTPEWWWILGLSRKIKSIERRKLAILTWLKWRADFKTPLHLWKRCIVLVGTSRALHSHAFGFSRQISSQLVGGGTAFPDWVQGASAWDAPPKATQVPANTNQRILPLLSCILSNNLGCQCDLTNLKLEKGLFNLRVSYTEEINLLNTSTFCRFLF